MNNLSHRTNKIGKGRRKSKKPQGTTTTISNRRNDSERESELVSNCVTPSETSLSQLSQQQQQQQHQQHQQELQQPSPLSRKTKLSTVKPSPRVDDVDNYRNNSSNITDRYALNKRTKKHSNSRLPLQPRRSTWGSYENEDDRLIASQPPFLPPNSPQPVRALSGNVEFIGATHMNSNNNIYGNSNYMNINNDSGNLHSGGDYSTRCSEINTFINNNSVVMYDTKNTINYNNNNNIINNNKNSSKTRTLYPPTILPSAVNNRYRLNSNNSSNNNMINTVSRKNSGSNSNSSISKNSNSGNSINHLRTLGRNSFLTTTSKNTTNNMYGVNSFNSGIVGDIKNVKLIDKRIGNVPRHGKREDWIMINNPAAKREVASEQTIHLEHTSFNTRAQQVNNERVSLPPSSRRYGSSNSSCNSGASNVRRLSSKNLTKLSAPPTRSRYERRESGNAKRDKPDDNTNTHIKASVAGNDVNVSSRNAMNSDTSCNTERANNHLDSLYETHSNNTFTTTGKYSSNNDNNNNINNNNNNYYNYNNSSNSNSSIGNSSNNAINNENVGHTSNNTEDEWKRDKLLRGSYVINEDYRRSERDNAQMISFLRERASALNKSRLALEGNKPDAVTTTTNTVETPLESHLDQVNSEVLSPKPPKSPSHATLKENTYTRTLLSPNVTSTKRQAVDNNINNNSEHTTNTTTTNSNNSNNNTRPILTATPPLPPNSSPAGSLLSNESPNISLTSKAQRKRRNVHNDLMCNLNRHSITSSELGNNITGGTGPHELCDSAEQETLSTPTVFTAKIGNKNGGYDRNSITNTTVNISLFNRRNQMQLAAAQRQSLLSEAFRSDSSNATTTTSTNNNNNNNNNNNKNTENEDKATTRNPSASPYDFGVVLSSGKSGSLPIVLTAGYGSTQGMRPTMEDEHFIQLNAKNARGGSVSMLGILDGHCGRRVAAMSAKWLPKYFFAHTALGDNNALALVEAIIQVDRALYHALSLKQSGHVTEPACHTNSCTHDSNSNNNNNNNNSINRNSNSTSSSSNSSRSNLEADKESDITHIESIISRNLTSLSSSNDPLNKTQHGAESDFDRAINVRASINNGHNINNNNNNNNKRTTNTTIATIHNNNNNNNNNSKDKKIDANQNVLQGVDLELDSFDFDNDEDSGRWDGVGSGGSTLITAAVHGRMLYVACLGDARAVLYDGRTTIAMSEDHKPQNHKELNRIARCGGFVQFGRVCGVLAVSRALGDFEFKFPATDAATNSSTSLNTPFYSSFITTSYLPPKITNSITANSNDENSQSNNNSSSSMSIGGNNKSNNLDNANNSNNNDDNNNNSNNNSNNANSKFSLHRELMVSNVADVKQLSLSDESKFLLLACDGLWDVISNEEATQFVKDFLTYTPNINDPMVAKGMKPYPSHNVVQKALNNCCTKLAEFAVDRGSSDNVTVMLLFFHDVVQVVTSFNKPISPSVTPSPSNSPSNGNIRNKMNSSVTGSSRKAE